MYAAFKLLQAGIYVPICNQNIYAMCCIQMYVHVFICDTTVYHMTFLSKDSLFNILVPTYVFSKNIILLRLFYINNLPL